MTKEESQEREIRKKSSPDLFFPASDSEGEDTNGEAWPVKSAQASSSSSTGSHLIGSRASRFTSGPSKDDDSDDDFTIVDHTPQLKETTETSRKRRSSVEETTLAASSIPSHFKKALLGEFVCEGWSLSKGKGYCSAGTKVLVERPKSKVISTEEPRKKEQGPVRLLNGKLVGGKAKQTTLMAQKKTAPVEKRAKAATDQIIRFRNDRGFEIGRLSVQDAGFLTHLLDTGVIQLSGHVVDCPQILTIGCTILLSIKVHITRKAFENFKGLERKGTGGYWEEQKETFVEEAMRLRKDNLAVLFNRIGLKPIKTSPFSQVSKIKHDEPGSSKLSDTKPRKTSSSSATQDGGKGRGKSSASDDGEEGSGDEGEELDDSQMKEIDYIYRKAQQGDNRLEETIPPSTFLYTLRPYQKQALTWMSAKEKGDASVRDQSLHPLWEEYLFRRDYKSDDVIEVSDDDKPDPSQKFYWNPYNGELSLAFPTSNAHSNGGILADAMGMGKTCMMSALIHLNREEDANAEDKLPEEKLVQEPISKRAKFRQVTLSNQWRPIPTIPIARTNRPRATLVVCPVSLASQWHEELQNMSEQGSIKSYMWYGNDRGDLEVLLAAEGEQKVDVLITSYGNLASDYQKWLKNKDRPNYEGGSLYDHEFMRIILDEAHNIKNRTAAVSKACYELKGRKRWAVSGTPIVNRLEDLYSLLHFLRITPWGEYSSFRSFVTVPFLNQDPKALNVVQYILESTLLRREKTMRDRDGRLIVDLPPKHLDIQVLQFSRPERQIYKYLEDKAKKKFIELDADGRAMSNYTSILAMLMKLRQCVNHPLLVLGKSGEERSLGDEILESDATEKMGSLKEMIAMYAGGIRAETPDDVEHAYATKVMQELGEQEEEPTCELCSNEMFDEVLLPCYHRSCQDCIVEWIGTCEDQDKPANCPSCSKGPLKVSDLRLVQRKQRKRTNPITDAYAKRQNNDQLQPSDEGAVTLGKVDIVSSTKIKALAKKLDEMRKEDPTFKALVFSQFTSFFDLMEKTLAKSGFRYLRFDGTMSQPQRAFTIAEFSKKTEEPLILLISLKAGGVGLNLTMANHVFMMDTWWNEAIEQQAIDRAHRLGQTKPVYVTRYIIKGTVEKRIMKIQRTKTALVNASLSNGQKNKEASLADFKTIFGLDENDSEDDGF